MRIEKPFSSPFWGRRRWRLAAPVRTQALLEHKLVADAAQMENWKMLHEGFGVDVPSAGDPARKMKKGILMK